MNLLESSVTSFTEQLASKSSVPGGGGASALVGAIGVIGPTRMNYSRVIAMIDHLSSGVSNLIEEGDERSD